MKWRIIFLSSFLLEVRNFFQQHHITSQKTKKITFQQFNRLHWEKIGSSKGVTYRFLRSSHNPPPSEDMLIQLYFGTSSSLPLFLDRIEQATTKSSSLFLLLQRNANRDWLVKPTHRKLPGFSNFNCKDELNGDDRGNNKYFSKFSEKFTQKHNFNSIDVAKWKYLKKTNRGRWCVPF